MKNNLWRNGFETVEAIYSKEEIALLLQIIEEQGVAQSFGIRSFLKSFPELVAPLFNSKLRELLHDISDKAYIIRSLYFDKPPSANWIVNWHQDLTINVKGKIDDENYKNWRVLKDRTVVQPPLEVLENIFTIRIHLDDCTSKNGALRVVPKSHQLGIVNLSNKLEELKTKKAICEVEKGGILIMKPLLFHASRRTENNLNRRVIHIEFCDLELPEGLKWKEAMVV